MRNSLIVVVGAALVAWLSAPGLAADQVSGSRSAPSTPTATQAAGNPVIHQGVQHTQMQGQAAITKTIRASDFIERDVYDSQQQKLGTVRDLVIRADNGKVCYLVMTRSTWDALLGKDYLAVPFDLFHVSLDAKNTQKHILVLNVRPDQLHGAPQFASNEWSIFGNQQFLSQVRQFYQGFERTALRPGGTMTNPSSTTPGARPASADHSPSHTSPKRKRGKHDQLPSLALRACVLRRAETLGP